jgi:hypothetical protein
LDLTSGTRMNGEARPVEANRRSLKAEREAMATVLPDREAMVMTVLPVN